MQTFTFLVLVVLLCALTGCVILYLRKNKGSGMTTEKLKEVQNLKSILVEAAFGIVTQLERENGEKSGELKLSNAIKYLLQLIPDQLKGLFNADVLANIIEDALADARLKWKQNPKLIEKK